MFKIEGVAGENYNQLTPEEKATVQAAGDAVIQTLKQQLTRQSDGNPNWNPAYQTEVLRGGQQSAREAAQRAAEGIFTARSDAQRLAERAKETGQVSVGTPASVPTPAPAVAPAGAATMAPPGIPGTGETRIQTPESPPINVAPPVAPGQPASSAPGTPTPTDPNAVVQPSNVPAPLAAFSTNLLRGMRSPEVVQLQGILGITQDGIFGPKTEAAVKSFQASNGLTADGVVGPRTMQAINNLKKTPNPVASVAAGAISNTNTSNTDPKTGKPAIPSTGDPGIDSLIQFLNNQSPQKSASTVYKEIYDAMGLSTFKANFESQTKAYSDLQEEKNKEKQEINNNPWFSEGLRVSKLRQLDAKYEGRELVLSNKLKLLETQIDNGRADAQFILGQTMDQLQQSSKLTQDIVLKAIDIAEKEAEAERKLIELSPGESVYDPKTRNVIYTSPKNTSPRSTPPTPTTKNSSSYTIKAGDTFFKLAQTNNSSVEAFRAANPGVNENDLKIGQKINLPGSLLPEFIVTTPDGKKLNAFSTQGVKELNQTYGYSAGEIKAYLTGQLKMSISTADQLLKDAGLLKDKGSSKSGKEMTNEEFLIELNKK